MFVFKQNLPITFAVSSTLVLATFTAIYCWSQSIQNRAMAPLLYLANGTVDLGVLNPHEVREVAFSIANKGSRRLVINQIACGCGEPRQKPILIPPGEIEEVILNLDTRFELGRIEKMTSFSTNDPTQLRFDLTIKAQVVAE